MCNSVGARLSDIFVTEDELIVVKLGTHLGGARKRRGARGRGSDYDRETRRDEVDFDVVWFVFGFLNVI